MNEIEKWLESIGHPFDGICSASSDASFRRYFRITEGAGTTIVMDSSLQKESVESFLSMNRRLADAGVRVPKVLASDMEQGFILLEDLGSTHLLDLLDGSNFEKYYAEAIGMILTIQDASTEGLSPYDREFLLFEMGLMEEWYLGKHLGYALEENEAKELHGLLEHIADTVLTQPQGVVVHRDFHSRNLMAAGDGLVAIDYQDARVGAVTYDLVSLLRDCYISFDPEKIEKLALSFRDRKGLDVSDEVFLRWFDYMGLQRHIKVLGIFARLSIRDGKHGYLGDIPQTLAYVIEAASKYPELSPLLELLDRAGAR